MCGIAGVFLGVKGALQLEAIATEMATAIRSRGPDGFGLWVDSKDGIAIAHRRLAIQDLSAAGHQPMTSPSRRWIIAFNGEIYNHNELRAELNAVVASWRGRSDTETLIAAFEHWGVQTTLQRCLGMFAVVLYDQHTGMLYLARDRFGEKPLYYGWVDGAAPAMGCDGAVFAFGSELKALRALPGFCNQLCRKALADYMRLQCVPAPRSIFQGIYKLEPGCLLTVKGAPPPYAPLQPIRPVQAYDSVAVERWWNPAEMVDAGAANPLEDEYQVVQALHESLDDSVRQQSLADVPLGAFLSGGVDSSTVVALMQKQAQEAGRAPVQTFTIGFDEPAFDESARSRLVAQHLGTEHHEMRVTSADALDLIPSLPEIYDEPFADSSQIPTHFVCRAAREKVMVALSGDGGDELFGGYNRYFSAPRLWNKVAWLPYSARQALGTAIAMMPLPVWDAAGASLGREQFGDRAHKFAGKLAALKEAEELYRNYIAEWPDPASILLCEPSQGADPPPLISDALPLALAGERADPGLKMMWWDSQNYLPDDILCKLDRAAMACSLETRVPFLDHRVAELAWRLPMGLKMRGRTGKWALRQVLHRYLPSELIDRTKMGFGIPIGAWLRGPLKAWADEMLSEQRLSDEGYFDVRAVRKLWLEHLSGSRDWTARLWTLLMFQAWIESL
jgi:asparagine synthase (glutamine-hydrolysing)